MLKTFNILPKKIPFSKSTASFPLLSIFEVPHLFANLTCTIPLLNSPHKIN